MISKGPTAAGTPLSVCSRHHYFLGGIRAPRPRWQG
jgi:hypothetical protein